MTGFSDMINKDDDGHLIRAIIGRLESLEAALSQVTESGMVIQLAGDLRSNAWSSNRAASIGFGASRWYRLNEVNETNTFDDWIGDPANRMTLVGSIPPIQGHPGGLRSDGSYSVKFDGAGNYLTYPQVAHGPRSWTAEVIFALNPAAATGTIFSTGGATGGVQVVSFGGVLVAAFPTTGVAHIISTTPMTAKNWYHAIFVGEAATNMSWYLGRFDPYTRQFSFQSGVIAMPTPPVAPSAPGAIGEFNGWVDEIVVFNGVLTPYQAENRVRAALQPGPPNGWLVADGAAVSRNEYAQLFSRIGTFNGVGNGSSTFNLPNYPGGIVKI